VEEGWRREGITVGRHNIERGPGPRLACGPSRPAPCAGGCLWFVQDKVCVRSMCGFELVAEHGAIVDVVARPGAIS